MGWKEVLMENKKVINRQIVNIYPLSPMQQGMLYCSIADIDSQSYIVQNVFDLKGQIEEEKIRMAFELLIKRYDVLRTAFVYKKLASPKQVVLREREADFESMDFTQTDNDRKEEKFQETVRKEVRRGFDLQNDPLLRTKLIQYSENTWKMVWTFHHIIMDGWCLGILFGTFTEYYQKLLENKTVETIEHEIFLERQQSHDYGEYIKWISEKDWKESFGYWKELLSGYQEETEIKPLSSVSEKTDQQVETEECYFSKEISSRLVELAGRMQVTVNTIAETIWGVTLQKYCGTDDVVFGKVVSGRNAEVPGIETMIGLFINTVPSRISVESSTTVGELLQQVQKQGANSADHSFCSLAEVQELTDQKTDLIKTLFVFENYEFDKSSLGAKESAFGMVPEQAREQTNYPLSTVASYEEGIFHFKILYDPSEFLEWEIKLVLERVQKIAEAFAKNSDKKTVDISIITEKEREEICGNFNKTTLAYPKEKTIIQVFEEEAEQHPDKTAVTFKEESITYKELEKRVYQLAWHLRKQGVRPDDFVALSATKSIQMIVGMLGILKAGGAYVPIDPEYPENRIQYMLNDCHPKCVVVYQTSIKTELPVIELEDQEIWKQNPEALENVTVSSNLAYCIYTSGTTGKPKGVMIENIGVLNLRQYFMEKQFVTSQDRVLQFASFAFDAAVSEISMSLLTGASLYITPDEIKMDEKQFEKFIEKNKISIAILPPQFLKQVNLKGLRTIITAGAETSKDIVEANTGIEIYSNDYGPTEVTVCATFWRHVSGEKVPKRIPIGRPMNNKQVYIFQGTNLCGFGIPGEICIGGDGLARGYLNKPELTEKKFIPNPFGTGKLYRTGDLGRWLPDGNMEYLGRIDEQVKIRGFRIELGEIESVLRGIRTITDAVVVSQKDHAGADALCAYVTSDTEAAANKIKSELKKYLPDYMIPSYVMQIPSIPVTTNGKLDKRALPKPDLHLYRAKNEYKLAESTLEKELTDIWKNVLKHDDIGARDNFFEIGGNSILTISMYSKIDEKYPGKIKVGDIFANPTIEKLAEFIESKSLPELTFTQIEIPGIFSGSKRHGKNEILYSDDGQLYQNLSAMYQQDEEAFFDLMLFLYCHVLKSISGQDIFDACVGKEREYCTVKATLARTKILIF